MAQWLHAPEFDAWYPPPAKKKIEIKSERLLRDSVNVLNATELYT